MFYNTFLIILLKMCRLVLTIYDSQLFAEKGQGCFLVAMQFVFQVVKDDLDAMRVVKFSRL